MPVYSKLVPDTELLYKVLGKYKSVYLIACAGCMNESIAFDSGLPIFSKDGNQLVFPAIESECKRLVQLLETNGILADYKVIPTGTNSRCIINLDEPHYPIDVGSEYEAVLVLSCPSGFRDICKQSHVPSFIISEQIGSINYCYEEIGDSRRIISGKVTAFGE